LDPEFHDFRGFAEGLAEGVKYPENPEKPEIRGPDPRKQLFSGHFGVWCRKRVENAKFGVENARNLVPNPCFVHF
jgi:hypothetical protein